MQIIHISWLNISKKFVLQKRLHFIKNFCQKKTTETIQKCLPKRRIRLGKPIKRTNTHISGNHYLIIKSHLILETRFDSCDILPFILVDLLSLLGVVFVDELFELRSACSVLWLMFLELAFELCALSFNCISCLWTDWCKLLLIWGFGSISFNFSVERCIDRGRVLFFMILTVYWFYDLYRSKNVNLTFLSFTSSVNDK